MATEGEFLDVDQAIGVDSSGREIKATPYLEDVIFGLLQRMGGEEGDLIDNSINVSSAPNPRVFLEISQLKKELAALSQLVAVQPMPLIEEDKEDGRLIDPTLPARIEGLSKAASNNAGRAADSTLPARIKDLATAVSNTDALAAGSHSEIADLRSILAELIKEVEALNKDLQKTAFGELSVAEPTQVVGLQFPYNINAAQVISFPGNGGTVTNGDNHANVSTGTNSDGFGLILSRDVLKYSPGEGAQARFTAKFTTGVASSEQIAGPGANLNGFFFGFNGTAFGVLRRSGGLPEVRDLQITTASTTAEDITITLDGDADATVTVTNSNDVCITAREIAAHNFASLGVGWGAEAHGDIVTFISLDAASHSGSYSLSGATTAVGTFSSSVVGSAATDTWTAQTAWSIDKMDGAGPSEMTLDPTKGNVYQVHYQWLGYGAIIFSIENSVTGEFQDVHLVQYSNANTSPSLTNPTLPLTLEARNLGNTSDLTVSSSSMAGFVEGKETLLGPSFASNRLFTIGNVTTEEPVLTIRNKRIYQGTINQVRITPEFITFVSNLNDARGNTTFRVYVGATPENGCSYTDVSTNSSVVEEDTAAIDFDTSTALLQSTFILSATESELFDVFQLKTKIAPGSTLMVTAQPSKGHATNEVGATINWKELF